MGRQDCDEELRELLETWYTAEEQAYYSLVRPADDFNAGRRLM